MRYVRSYMVLVWLSSKTQDRTQNLAQNPESKIFEQKPGIWCLGRKNQPNAEPWSRLLCSALITGRLLIPAVIRKTSSIIISNLIAEKFKLFLKFKMP